MSDALKRSARERARMTLSARVIPWAILWAAAAVLAVYYIASPLYPFAFYSDLGADIATTQYIAATIHSPSLLADNMGWYGWFDAPAFAYAPFLGYVVLAAENFIFRDAVTAVKAQQVLQFAIAFAGGQWCYRKLTGDFRLSGIAGVLYALSPIVLFNIRGNANIGWVVALQPVALAASLALLQRLSAYALPLIGLICSIVGFGFHPEYGLVVGLPLYVGLALRQVFIERRIMAALCAAAGLFCFACFPAYMVLATFGVHHLFTDPPARLLELRTGDVLGLFSEGLTALAGLTPQEILLSPRPLLNAIGTMPLAWTGGALVWLGFISACLRARRERRSMPLLATMAACLLLGLGTTWWLGSLIWNLFAALPLLNALRTPDRFLTLPLMYVVLWAVWGYQWLFARTSRTKAAAGAALAVAASAFVLVGAFQHVFSLEPYETAEPDLPAVRSAVAALGGRTVSFAFPRGQSIFDTPLYGVPQPTVSFQWELLERNFRGDLGAESFRRLAVHSIITSPSWLTEGPDLPSDLGLLYARERGVTTAAQFPSGVRVLSVARARDWVTPVLPVCYTGGPGLFDIVGSASRYMNSAFLIGRSHCVESILAGYSPLDDFAVHSALWSEPGSTLFARALNTASAGMPFEVGRSYLAEPWMRSSFDGDARVYTRGLPAILSTDAFVARSVSAPRDGEFWLYAHIGNRAPVLLSVAIAAANLKFEIPPHRGFHWYRISLGRLHAGQQTLTIALTGQTAGRPVAVDGMSIGAAAPPATNMAHTGAVAVSLSKFHEIHEPGLQQQIELIPSDATAYSKLSNFAIGYAHGQLGLIADAPQASAAIRWPYATGTYAVQLQARIPLQSDSVQLSSGGQAMSFARADTGDTDVTTAYATLRLVHGHPLRISAALPNWYNRPAPLQITGLRFQPVQASLAPVDVRPGNERYELYPRDSLLFSSAVRGTNLTFENSGVTSRDGGLTFTLTPDVASAAVTALVTSEGSGEAEAVISCGGHQSRSSFSSGTASLTVVDLGSAPCTVHLAWTQGGLLIKHISVAVTGAQTQQLSDRVYIPTGRFIVTALDNEMRSLGSLRMYIDGRSIRPGEATAVAAGYHDISLYGVPASANSLLMIRKGTLSAPPPTAITRVSSNAWNVKTTAAEMIELADLNDGLWILQGQGSSVRGISCDGFNTCFNVPRSGSWRIRHRFSPLLRDGFLMTLLGILVALAITGASAYQRRSH